MGCVAIVAVTLAALAKPELRARLGLAPARPASYSVGDRIDVPDRLFAASPLTLLVFVRSNCGACQSAKPAFARITSQLGATSTRTVIVTAGARSAEELGYATDVGLDRTHLETMDFSNLKLQVVPTLVLVDQRGKVLYAVEGVPSDAQQQDVLRATTIQPSR